MIEDRRKAEEALHNKIIDMKGHLFRARGCREKLRIIKLLNTISDSGHTVFSWAAACGSMEICDLLMRAGAPAGYTISMIHACATYLQHSYRLYRLRTEVKAFNGGGKVNMAWMLDEDIEKLRIRREKAIENMMKLNQRRQDILTILTATRRKMRFPIPEAAYMGRWEVILRIHEKEQLHYNFTGTWAFPSPPMPFHRHRNRHAYNGTKVRASYSSNMCFYLNVRK
jgi:hypothetical protein